MLIFWTKFAQKGYFRSKAEKNKHHSWIQHTQTRLDIRFQLRQSWFFGPNLLNSCRKMPEYKIVWGLCVTQYIWPEFSKREKFGRVEITKKEFSD